MGADLVLLYECRPRRELGDGDDTTGTRRILSGIKALDRAEAIAERARAQGQDLDAVRITVVRATPEGTQEREAVGYHELRRGYDPLVPYEADCQNCPANRARDSFGCNGYLNYPITAAAENWLLGRVQPPDTVGGQLLTRALKDFRYDGEPIARFRETGLFELRASPVRRFKTGVFPSVSVSSDQLFQSLLCVGEPLNPAHCFGVLNWLGALRYNREVVSSPHTLAEMLALPDAVARSRAVSLDLGPPAEDAGTGGVQQMLALVYYSWVLDVPLWLDA